MALEWEGILVITSVAVALIIMAGDWVGPDIVFSALLAFLVAARTIPVNAAAQGYGNVGLLTVVMLYIVAEGVSQTGGLERFMTFVLGRSRSTFWALVRFMVPVMFLSAFLNNTPVVSLMVPIIFSWCRRNGVPPKKMLIPLSYSAVLGGTCTLIGTSTNLVISGLQSSRYEKLKDFANVRFEIFDIAPYGVPYAIWGTIFIILTQRWLLPGNSTKFEKNLLIALRVLHNSPVRRKTLLETGLCQLTGLKVVAVARKAQFFREPYPDFVLEVNDIVYFAGELDQAEYIAESKGLGLVTSATELSLDGDTGAVTTTGASPYAKLVQATISKDANIIGIRIRDLDLRTRFSATLVAIKRGNGRVDCPFSDITLQIGDVLVLDTALDFDANAVDFKANFVRFEFLKDGAAKEFIVAMKVVGSPTANATVTDAGLRGIPGLYAMAVDKANGDRLDEIDNETHIELGDSIWFAADIDALTFLTRFPGLEMLQQEQADKTSVHLLYRSFTQAAISYKSPLVGKTVGEVKFRQKFNAAIVAVHREEERVPLRIKDIVFRPGDVLVLSAQNDFAKVYKNDKTFIVLNAVPASSFPKRKKMLISLFLMVAMVTTQIVGGIVKEEYISLWPCAVLTFTLMLGFGCMSADQARASILWEVYLTIAAAFGVSQAMERNGVAKEFADLFIDLARKIGGQGAALTSIYVATALLSEILTNNAAGAIMYPIAALAGDALDVTPRSMSIAIMLGASAGFINPFSYQCNLMVFTAGNYRTLEFAKIGSLFQVNQFIVSAIVLFLYDDWQYVWAVSFAAFGLVVGIPLLWALLPARLTVRWELTMEAYVTRTFATVATVLRPLAFWRAKPSLVGSPSGVNLVGRGDLPTFKHSGSNPDSLDGSSLKIADLEGKP